jgi:nucleosome assembly protein 1-like 1
MDSRGLPEPGRNQYQSEFLQKNPAVAGPVRSLLDLQSRYFALNQQFQDDMWRLEQQHYARCQSLFRDRGAIVNSTKKGALYSTAAVNSYRTSPAPANGIPHFWLQAMKNNPRIAKWIHPRDEPALSYLRDIRVEFMDNNVTRFRILFDFDENPFFSDAEGRNMVAQLAGILGET